MSEIDVEVIEDVVMISRHGGVLLMVKKDVALEIADEINNTLRSGDEICGLCETDKNRPNSSDLMGGFKCTECGMCR